MLETGKTFLYYRGDSFAIAGESEVSEMMERVFKKNDVNYFIIDWEQPLYSVHAFEVFRHKYNNIGLVHNGEIYHGEQGFVVEGMKREDIELDIRELLERVEQ